MADKDFEVGMDTAKLEKGFDKMWEIFATQNEKLEGVRQHFVQVNEAGEAMIVKFAGVTDAGREFTATFQRVEKELELTSVAFRKTTEDAKALRLEKEKLAAEQAELKAGDKFDKAFDETLQKIQNNQRKIAESEARAGDDFDKAFEQTLQKIQNNQERLAAQLEKEVIIEENHRRKLLAELLETANEAEAARRASVAQAVNVQGAAAVRGRVAEGISFDRATPEQIQRINRALDDLVAHVAKGEIDVNRFGRVMQLVAGGSARDFAGAERDVADGVIKLRAAVGDAAKETALFGKATEETGSKIFLTWDNIFRFIQYRFVYTAISRLTGLLKESITEAAAFQIKISEIRTISQDNQLSFGKWSDAVRRLSDEFGNPIADVAKGVYETLSNQIARGAAATEFMAKAQKFAQTTVATTEESVNLLSSALNSFHKDVTETDKVSAIFFKTIDLGRVVASEMANTFGRVGTFASSLGVSLEETNAAIATLTINGIKYSESFTLINNVFQKLNKPTEAMKKLFAEWGVETGESAVKTFGFVGVLRKLEEATHGSSAEIAELFRDIRATRGAIGLTGSAFEGYEKTLDKITNESLPAYREAQKIALESAGRDIGIQLNKIKNSLIEDFGNPAVDIILQLGRLLGGDAGLSGAFRNLTRVTEVGLAVFLAYKLEWQAIAVLNRNNIDLTRILTTDLSTLFDRAVVKGNSAWVSLKNFGAGLMALVTPANVALAAITGVILVLENQQEANRRASTAREDALGKLAEHYRKVADEAQALIDTETKGVSESIRGQVRVRLQAAAEATAFLNKLIAENKKHFDESKDDLKLALEAQVDVLKISINELQKFVTKATDNVKNAKNLLDELRDKAETKDFELTLEFAAPQDRSKVIAERVAQIRSNLTKLSLNVGDTPDAVAEKMKRYKEQATELGNLLKDQARERVRLEKERQELELKVKEGGTRDDFRTAQTQRREQIRQEADDLVKLQTEYNKTTGQRHTALQKEIAEHELAQKALLKADRDAASDEANKEADRRADAVLDKEREKLGVLTAQINSLPDLIALRKELGAIEAQEVTNLEDITKSQKGQADAAQAELDARQRKFDALKLSFEELIKFKLPTKPVGTEQEKTEAFAPFDLALNRAIQSGLDPQTLFQIQQRRVKLSEEADLEIQAHTLATQKETLEKTSDDLIKKNEDLGAARKKAAERTVEDIKQVRAGIAELDEAANKLGGQITSVFEGVIAGQESFGEMVEHARKLADQVEKTQKPADILELNRIMGELAHFVVLFSGHVTPDFAEELLVKKPTLTEPKGRTLVDVTNENAKAIQDLIKLQGERAKLDLTQKQTEDQLKAAGININKTQSLIDKMTATSDEFGEKFRIEVINTANSLVTLENAISEAAKRIKEGKVGPVSFNSTPAGPGAVTTTANSFGPISVTVNSTGNAQLDGRQIASALQNELRNRTVSLG